MDDCIEFWMPVLILRYLLFFGWRFLALSYMPIYMTNRVRELQSQKSWRSRQHHWRQFRRSKQQNWRGYRWNRLLMLNVLDSLRGMHRRGSKWWKRFQDCYMHLFSKCLVIVKHRRHCAVFKMIATKLFRALETTVSVWVTSRRAPICIKTSNDVFNCQRTILLAGLFTLTSSPRSALANSSYP